MPQPNHFERCSARFEGMNSETHRRTPCRCHASRPALSEALPQQLSAVCYGSKCFEEKRICGVPTSTYQDTSPRRDLKKKIRISSESCSHSESMVLESVPLTRSLERTNLSPTILTRPKTSAMTAWTRRTSSSAGVMAGLCLFHVGNLWAKREATQLGWTLHRRSRRYGCLLYMALPSKCGNQSVPDGSSASAWQQRFGGG